MKSIHIIANVDVKMGGTSYALLNILRLEKRIGLDSTVVTLDAHKCDPEISKLANLVVFNSSFPSRFSRSRYANNWLINNAINYDFAVIHTIWGILQIEASRILHKLRLPFIVWPHGSLDPFDLRKKKYLKKILGPLMIRPMLDKSKAILCTSKLEQKKIERYGAKSKCKVLPLPIDFIKTSGDRDRFRNKYLLKEDDFVLLFLSRIDYKKGLNLLIPAVKKISRKYSNLKLLIAGSGTNRYQNKIETLIKIHGLEDRIVMPGFLSGQDKKDAYIGSDCFILPSMNENFGIAVVESLIAGLPVLISKNVYIWEDIIRYGGGWVCDYSIDSLAKAITIIIESPNDLKIKKRNTKYSAEQFSHNKLGYFYEQFYRELHSTDIERKINL